jgi:RES domain-containing protein
MEVYRLAREKYAATLSGKGAAIKGARWNSPGVELIYTATNRSLAMAEVAVHLTFATLPKDFMMVTIYIPDNLAVKTIQVHDLPPDWNIFPHPDSTRHIGNNFVHEQEQCLLMVPSAVTKGDFNMLINPNHRDFSKITIQNIEKFPFDRRVFKS